MIVRPGFAAAGDGSLGPPGPCAIPWAGSSALIGVWAFHLEERLGLVQNAVLQKPQMGFRDPKEGRRDGTAPTPQGGPKDTVRDVAGRFNGENGLCPAPPRLPWKSPHRRTTADQDAWQLAGVDVLLYGRAGDVQQRRRFAEIVDSGAIRQQILHAVEILWALPRWHGPSAKDGMLYFRLRRSNANPPMVNSVSVAGSGMAPTGASHSHLAPISDRSAPSTAASPLKLPSPHP